MKENIDELFRKSLNEQDIPFEEMHWLAMEQKLDQKLNKRKAVVWWTLMSGVAALLLIVFAWWNLRIEDNPAPLKSTKINKNRNETIEAPPALEEKPGNNLPSSDDKVNQEMALLSYTSQKRIKAIIKPSEEESNIFEINPRLKTLSIPSDLNLAEHIETRNIPNQESFNIEENLPANQPLINIPVKPEDKAPLTKPKFRTGLTLSFTAAPDLNAVNTFKRNSLGANAGILATVSVSPKLSFTTGLVYAIVLFH